MKLYDLTESINDKGLFKAVFFTGIPGAGKSYVTKKISDGAIDARVVNIDKHLEFLGKHRGVDISKPGNARTILDTSRQNTISQLTNYVNGMLPLFVDGTSANKRMESVTSRGVFGRAMGESPHRKSE